MPKKQILTPNQEKTMKFVTDYKAKHKTWPTTTLIGKRFKISSGAAWSRFEALKTKNLIK